MSEAARPSLGDGKIRVLLADDQAMVRDGLAVLLEADGTIEVAAQAADGAEALTLVRASVGSAGEEAAGGASGAPGSPGHIDVVVMDIRMPGMDGIAATAAIVREFAARAPRVLILTTFGLDEYVYDALGAGAAGFLLKDAPAAELIHAVHVIAAGDALLSPQVTRVLIQDVAERRRRDVPANPGAAAALTPRELDVLREIAKGRSNAEIAQHLYLAEHTVKTHVGRILDKLALRDRTQAVVFAYENGLTAGRGN